MMREPSRPRALTRARAFVAAGLLLLFGCADASDASDPPGLSGGAGGSSTTAVTNSSTGAGAQGGMPPSTTSSVASTTSGSGGALPGLRYHEIRAKSSHNAYERDEGLFDQLAYHRVRSLELDIHTDKVGWPSQKDDWYVYHDKFSPQTTCHRLSDCLRELRAFHDAVPEHEVITLILDLKTGFKSGQDPEALDALLSSTLSASTLFTPDDLLARCSEASTIRDAVTGNCSWPSLDTLRGRIIVMMTGGDGCASSSYVSSYVSKGTTATKRSAFIAPDVHSPCPWSSYATGQDHVAFFNMKASDASNASDVRQAGLVARVWGLNTPSSWGAARNAGANHLGTDMVNHLKDGWTITHTDDGYPFECLTGCPTPTSEQGALLSVEVDSGDLWETKDSFLFAPLSSAAPTNEAVSWSAYVATASSHVEPWAKACAMARSSLDADAAYVAVCRPADNYKIRLQVRTKSGSSTKAYDVKINEPDTTDDPSAPFVKLELDAGRKTARGYASQDGKDWVLIKQVTVDEPLIRGGLAASSHDKGPIRFLFGNLRRKTTNQAATTITSKDLLTKAIGEQASGTVSDGF